MTLSIHNSCRLHLPLPSSIPHIAIRSLEVTSTKSLGHQLLSKTFTTIQKYSPSLSPTISSPYYPFNISRNSTISIRARFNNSMEEDKSFVPGVIVGAGRVGQALYKLGGEKDILIRRGESVPENSTGPIFICTRNDALDPVYESTPPSRRQDFVFLQNGMIEPWIESKGLSVATQLLVYFAVSKIGELPIDGITDVNPEGLTAVCGKWAQQVATRLHLANLSCKVLDPIEFRKCMLEKLIWISAFMLVGVKNDNVNIGTVESVHRNEVEQLIVELAYAAEQEKGIKFNEGLVERLCAYARSVSHYPTAVKEFEWRNGWFYSLSKKALSEGKFDPCPVHTSWLTDIKVI